MVGDNYKGFEALQTTNNNHKGFVTIVNGKQQM